MPPAAESRRSDPRLHPVTSPPIPTDTPSQWLHRSPARDVYLEHAAVGRTRVIKLFVQGAMAAAEREFQLGRAAAGDGVVEHLEVGFDPQHKRTDLEALVAATGPLPLGRAAALVADAAATLARLHGLRTAALPHGLCHGDVKPANLLHDEQRGEHTLLLDFEHARPIGARTTNEADGSAAFTGGTEPFAPPEAHRGAPPDAAFDVYGLGRTLAFLLHGRPLQGRLLQGKSAQGRVDERDLHHSRSLVPAVARELVDRCCDADPRRRPTAATVAEELRTIATDPAVAAADARRHDWATATFASPPSSSPRSGGLDDDADAVWRRRQRLLQRRPQLLRQPAAVPTDPGSIARELASVGRLLDRFPRHAGMLRWRRDLVAAAAHTLAATAAHTQEAARGEEFGAALEWIDACRRLVDAVRRTPAGLRAIARLANAPDLLGRAPLTYLDRLAAKVADAEHDLAERVARVRHAEATFDLNTADAELDALAAFCGGAAPTTTRVRDKLHRLAFYLDRAARAEGNVERLAGLWDAAALEPLRTLVGAAATAVRDRARGDLQTTVGLRSLQITLANLGEEFPHVESVAPALEALTAALQHLTEQAWQTTAEAERLLQKTPVPLRPLQLAIGRLDSLRVLEAYVDRADRPRSALLDGLERIRLGLEQARAARDRLAEDAEHALARGHWTTGLFEMERAVAGLDQAGDEDRAEADRLRERIQEARQRREEVDQAVRRNVDLATRYAALEDDPSSASSDRLHALEARRDCLMFLVMHVSSDRASLYRRDLRAVETQIAIEVATAAEQRFDAATDGASRSSIARRTLEQLAASAAQHGTEPPGRLVRLVEHWRTVVLQCDLAESERQAERARRQRQRRRMLALACVAAVITTTAVAFALRPWLFAEPAQAAERAPGGPR
jgi:hypothetical protein